MADPTGNKNVVASVRQRLLNWAKANDSVFDLVLQRYVAERFLYRLGISSEVDRFTLKGASLFLVWAGNEFRATRDVDLLGTGSRSHEAIRAAMTTICTIEDPRETVIAEKFEAMVTLGMSNSRMKDFWDVAALAQEFEFDGETLRTAIKETFHRRGTTISKIVPEALRPAFYEDEERVVMWESFRKKSGLRLEVPTEFAAMGERVIEFLGPVRESAAMNAEFGRYWNKGGPWQTSESRR